MNINKTALEGEISEAFSMLKSMKISFFLTYSYKGYIFPVTI